MNLLDQETDDKHPNPITPIIFHTYHIIARYTKHGRILLPDKEICCKCQHDTDSGKLTKINTRK